MSYGRAYAFSTLAVVTVLALPADGQSVISTRSGVIHFFEGAVYLGEAPMEPHLGKYPRMAEGAELRTEQGRAEVLLTPGVFLRMGERSAIRLVGNDLADTRVQLLAGSAIVDSAEPSSGTSVTLIYKDWKVRFLQKGIYRIDSDPPRLSVRQGSAEVSAGATGAPVSVTWGMNLPLAAVLVPERSIDEPADGLANWAHGRSESISADNAITAQIDEDPASRSSDLAVSSFTYFPFIGALSVSPGVTSLYSSYAPPYQPGFNSIYLPGYTYRPLLLGLMPRIYTRGYSNHIYSPYSPYSPHSPPYSPPRRAGFSPGTGAVAPVPLPHAPPLRTTPARPITHGGVRGGHR
jgi:hypothetical protein